MSSEAIPLHSLNSRASAGPAESPDRPSDGQLNHLVDPSIEKLESTEKTVSGPSSAPSRSSQFRFFSSIPLLQDYSRETMLALRKYARFIGPGLMVSVAYMDPGNYAAAVDAGAKNQFSLLFFLFLSNIFAIFLQSLCIKLGSVTGMDLARCCREFLPRWFSLILYVLAEAAIIATDLAEVIGSAIALNLLLKIPLWGGILLTVFDVLLVLMAYKPGSSMKLVRTFEYVVAALVFAVVICFCILMSMMPATNVGKVFRGYLPSSEMFENGGAYTACALLGATVMPHSLFLGSGLVQPRLREYDVMQGNVALQTDADLAHGETEAESTAGSGNDAGREFRNHEKPMDQEELYYAYRPTNAAIRYALKYSIVECAVTLFTFALFVNSAILVVAGISLYGTERAYDADLYTIYELLQEYVAPAVGTVFMVALLFSGQSAGIVCTIAGQMVSEGFLKWTITPWLRRIITRMIAIIPCLGIALGLGRNGLGDALTASQVVLSVLLPFLSAPLIFFTAKKSVMHVRNGREDRQNEEAQMESESGAESSTESGAESTESRRSGETRGSSAESERLSQSSDVSREENEMEDGHNYANNIITSIIGFLIWLFISGLNIYMIVDLARGN